MSDFLSPDLEIFLAKLNIISSDTAPLWGAMNAQQMIEHLSNSIDLSMGKIDNIVLSIPEDKVPKALTYLNSDKPFPQGVKVDYAPENPILRNESIDEAVDELAMKWVQFEEHFTENPDKLTLHPVYGDLDYSGWLRMHSKHFTHHFTQFNL